MLGEESSDVGEVQSDTQDESQASVDEYSETEKLDGKPGSDPEKQGLMHSVLDSDSTEIDLGNMVMDAVNNGGNMFTPELLMEKIVRDYRSAENMFGPTLIRVLSGYDPSYVEKNVKIPEFRRELEKQIKENAKQLEKQGILAKGGGFTDEALELAAVVLAMQELDHLTAQGNLGRRVHKKQFTHGTREEAKPYANERYRDINVAQSVKTALRRSHKRLLFEDLRTYEREGRGKTSILYAVDASGSMKGAKIAQAKRAGIALAYKAIQEGDKVGLVVFGKDIDRSIPPCRDFSALLPVIARLTSGSETDIAGCIRHSMTLFSGKDNTKQLILLTDALPTIGEDPNQEVLSAVSEAREAGIIVSIIGIALDAQGEKLAQEATDLGRGRLAVVKDIANLDVIILEQYDAMK